ncbi:hypothetical protein HanXRQr2_Chr12g0549001 [Helianthus annuus]|uniref:Uncharacterized protein n=1 Tax=Helianthus annuus TaxID=4232 RepID=A0A9K3MWT4_HELAN|nr:hypothetical protein HanXRQr2_Chr12g0549001 [Helianthus annuus]KAJ0863317.1 hypothetical protein HanPSC8_Chr12g0528561 [Helianthus annuus]
MNLRKLLLDSRYLRVVASFFTHYPSRKFSGCGIKKILRRWIMINFRAVKGN